MVSVLPSSLHVHSVASCGTNFELGRDVDQLVAQRGEDDAADEGARPVRVEHVGILLQADPQRLRRRGRARSGSPAAQRAIMKIGLIDMFVLCVALSWFRRGGVVLPLAPAFGRARGAFAQRRAVRRRGQGARPGILDLAPEVAGDLRGRPATASSAGCSLAAERPSRAGSGCGSGSRAAARPGSARRPAAAASAARRSGLGHRDRRQQAPACRDAAASSNRSSRSLSSTISPRYITATRSLMCRITARSCAMMIERQAEAVLQILEQVDDLRLDRHVERRDRLVADDELRLAGERPGDADALALAAGELVRIAVAHAPGCRPTVRRSSATRRCRSRSASPGRAARSARRRCRRTFMRGLSEANGSWKMICISRRSLRISSAADRVMIAALDSGRRRRSARSGAAAAGRASTCRSRIRRRWRRSRRARPPARHHRPRARCVGDDSRPLRRRNASRRSRALENDVARLIASCSHAPRCSSSGAYQQRARWPGADLDERRRLARAARVGEGAARREAAARAASVSAGGTVPGIVASRPSRRPSEGTEPIRPMV